MPDRWMVVRQWRERARELRCLAESLDIPSAKDGIEHAAANYDRMADELERWLKAQEVEPRPSIALTPVAT